MKTETKILGVVLILTLVLLFGGVFLLSRGQSGSKSLSSDTVLQIDYSKGQKIGSDSAKVKLVEFSDFECPACLAAEPTVQKLRTAYPDKMQFIYRYFPLTQHVHSQEAATVAEAAAQQGKFWEMHDKLFETQTKWTTLSKPDANAFFLDLAKQLGLDIGKIQKALTENAYQAKINADLNDGQNLGVSATPTFFLDGRKVIFQTSFDDLTTAIAQEIKNQYQ